MTINAEPLWDWVAKRHSVYIRQAMSRGEPVFTSNLEAALKFKFNVADDPILRDYRFCNVFRELDRVTRWVDVHIRKPFADCEYLWFMLAIARIINWPDTLAVLMSSEETWPINEHFSPFQFANALERLKDEGKKVYTGAYLIRPESKINKPWYGLSKQHYVGRIVLGNLWDDRKQLSEFFDSNQSVRNAHARFMQYWGWGSFMSYQVCVDMIHTRYLQDAPDQNTWAALGPGSTRGLNRLAERPTKKLLKPEQGVKEMVEIYTSQNDFRPSFVPRVGLSDIQNCLCETDKYLRAKNGEGRLHNHYRPIEG